MPEKGLPQRITVDSDDAFTPIRVASFIKSVPRRTHVQRFSSRHSYEGDIHRTAFAVPRNWSQVPRVHKVFPPFSPSPIQHRGHSTLRPVSIVEPQSKALKKEFVYDSPKALNAAFMKPCARPAVSRKWSPGKIIRARVSHHSLNLRQGHFQIYETSRTIRQLSSSSHAAMLPPV